MTLGAHMRSYGYTYRTPSRDGALQARLKWADLAKEQANLAAKVKNVPKLEAKVDELKQNLSKLHNVHQAEIEGLYTAHQAEVERLCGLHSVEIERKNSFYKFEKV